MESYKGLRVGVDAHCWLHRGSYGCSKELAEGTPTTKYIDFCIGMLEMLMSYGVEDIIGKTSSCFESSAWKIFDEEFQQTKRTEQSRTEQKYSTRQYSTGFCLSYYVELRQIILCLRSQIV